MFHGCWPGSISVSSLRPDLSERRTFTFVYFPLTITKADRGLNKEEELKLKPLLVLRISRLTDGWESTDFG